MVWSIRNLLTLGIKMRLYTVFTLSIGNAAIFIYIHDNPWIPVNTQHLFYFGRFFSSNFWSILSIRRLLKVSGCSITSCVISTSLCLLHSWILLKFLQECVEEKSGTVGLNGSLQLKVINVVSAWHINDCRSISIQWSVKNKNLH